MDWATLFERAEAYETDVATIRETLATRRSGRETSNGETSEGRDDA
ncbi:hypothetical protein [Halorussus halophilus]|nr:hypothetical protein [Halorussus halophilus]